MTEKSVLEQALLQVQNLEEAVKANAKGILASTMKQELSELLKESLEKEEGNVFEQPTPDEEEDDVPADDAGDETTSDDEDEMSSDDEDEMSSDDEDEMSSDDETTFDYEDEPSDDEMPSDDGVMDMTGASHDEVLKVFKAMKPEDGIIVKKDDDELDLEINGDEYIIKLDGEDESQEGEFSEEVDGYSEEGDMQELLAFYNSDFKHDDNEMTNDGDEMTNDGDDAGISDYDFKGKNDFEETVYEIELDDMDSEEGKIEATEAARTKSNPHGNKGGLNRSGLPSKKKYKAGSGVFGINEEVSKLRKQNSEYKKALVLFKEKLNEVAVFNANLAYATRLFTEHSTTKQEKLNIMKRFDSISTMNESKNLFNTIKADLETKKPVTESVVNKITSTPSTSASEVLSESKAYENPQFRRMKDLMNKIK